MTGWRRKGDETRRGDAKLNERRSGTFWCLSTLHICCSSSACALKIRPVLERHLYRSLGIIQPSRVKIKRSVYCQRSERQRTPSSRRAVVDVDQNAIAPAASLSEYQSAIIIATTHGCHHNSPPSHSPYKGNYTQPSTDPPPVPASQHPAPHCSHSTPKRTPPHNTPTLWPGTHSCNSRWSRCSRRQRPTGRRRS